MKKVGRPVSVNPRRHHVGVLLTTKEHALLERLAAESKQTMSTTMRNMLLRQLKGFPISWVRNTIKAQ